MAVNFASNMVEKMMDNIPTTTEANANPGLDEDFADPSGEKMRALAWFGKNDVRMITTNKPKVVDPTDVILKVTGSTVCGSDLHLYHGSIIELQKGDILGHEFCGIIDSVGSSVTKRKIGEKVVASFQIACGDCYYCKRKLSSQCNRTNSSSLENAMYGHRTAGMFGYSHFTGGFAGGQAEYVRVPFGDVNLLKIPENVPDEKALYLSDVLSTSYHCVVDTGVKEGDIVGIWGMGAIGILAAKWAFLKGASRVIAIDKDSRLDYAKSKIPQLEILNYTIDKDVPKKIMEMTDPDHPGLDCALECAAGEYPKSVLNKIEFATGLQTDTAEIINECIMSVKNFGRVGVTGVYAGFANHFNIGAVMEKGVRFIGNGQAPVHLYWEEILNDYLIPGKIDPLELIVTHRIGINDVAKCYRKQDAHEDGVIKVFVETKFSDAPAPGAPKLVSME